MTFTEFDEKVRGFLDNATSQIAAWMAKKDVEYKEKVAVNQIQAQGALRNAQRMAMREMPVVLLNPAQEEALLFPEFRGQGARIQLDHAQADAVMNHMIKQHSLDAESREELAEAITPLVGIPNMIRPIFKIHKLVATSWVIKDVNDIKGEKDLRPISYRNIVGRPLFIGTNRDISLVYNLQSKEICEFVYNKYQENGQYLEDVRLSLKDVGVEIMDAETNGAFLEVTIKWTGA